MSAAFVPTLTTMALLPQQLGLVWDPLLKADPEGPTLIFHAASQHVVSSPSNLLLLAAAHYGWTLASANLLNQKPLTRPFKLRADLRRRKALLAAGAVRRRNI